MSIVLGDVFYSCFGLIQILLQSHYFPLFLLYKSNGGEDVPDDALILSLMILVQPEIINHHEHPPVASLLEHIEEGSHAGKDGETLAPYHTLSILVPDVELGALHTVGPGEVAGLAAPITVLLADILLNELVLDAVGSILKAFTSL